MSASPLYLRTLSTGAALLLLGALLTQCADTPMKPLNTNAPQFQPVISPTTAKGVKSRLTQSQSGRSHRLVPAKDRILGVHVPANFALKTRNPGKAYGTVVAKTRHIKAFYASLDYQVVDQRTGIRIYPTDRSTQGLDRSSREMAKSTYIALVRGKNLVWSLQIHAPPPTLSKEEQRDPMEFIRNTLHKAQEQEGEKAPVLLVPSEDEDAQSNTAKGGKNTKTSAGSNEKPRTKPRRYARPSTQRKIYIQPQGAVNLRPGLRRWNKNHPDKPFLD